MKLAIYGPALAVFATGTALEAAVPPSAHDLAGRYTHSFRNGDISGDRFTSTDSAIIVATDRSHAVVDLQLNFFNGHECSIGGMAELDGRQLVFRDSEMQGFDGASCELRIWRDGARLRWTDGEGSCRGYCGARGGLSDGEMRWSSRRPIPRAEQARILRDLERSRALP